MERLKHEIYEILEQAIDWWGDRSSLTRWRDGDNEEVKALQRSAVR